MPATVQFSESNLVGQVVTDGITNINFGSVDDHDLNTSTYSIIRGTNSFSKYIRVLFTDTWTVISNMKFWKSSGAYKTDESISAGFNVTYATPDDADMRDTGIGDTPVPAASPASNVNSAEGDSTIVYGATGVSGYTGYIRLQTQTLVTTPTGAVTQKEFTFQYDEI